MLALDLKYIFEDTKVTRESYYVEYKPIYCVGYASVCLNFIEEMEHHFVIRIMEQEAEYWLLKYPIPICVRSFDKTQDYITVKDWDNSNLYVWIDPETTKIKRCWELDRIPDFTKEIFKRDEWPEIITDIPYITYEEHQKKCDLDRAQRAKTIKAGRFFFATIFGVIPAIWAIVLYFDPIYIGLLATCYVIIRNVKKIKRMILPKYREKETPKEEKERKMKYYYYHCEKNPDAFMRLVVENNQKEAEGKIIEEFNKLKS